MQACSAPPIYWSTGIQYSAFFLSNGSLSFLLSQYLKKYQLLSKNVSIVSVSLLAFPLHFGHSVFTKSLFVAKGLPFPNFTFSGNKTGRSFSSTGTTPQLSQCMNGIGVPQYLCL